MAKKNDNEKMRKIFMETVKKTFCELNQDVLLVKSNTFSIPFVYENGDEGYMNITFSIPKGARGSEGYDGYEEAQNYAFECEEKAKKKAKKEAEKKSKIERNKKKKESE